MADDIVERLRVIHCAADDLTPCGTCLPCQAADEIERLRAEREAIEAIHQPMGKPAACCTCWKSWPCRTHLLLHPEEARRG